MTLTEEQREAIRVISKLPMAIGCQLCHPYIMKNYGSHFIVLRAMIDSSEHVTDHTKMIGFDLERARGLRDFLQDDCAEVGDVWGEMIAEIERLRPFEIAARDLDSDLTKIAGERDDQAARIKELEDALAEERAKYNLSWKDCAYRAPDTYCEKTHNYCTSEDCPLLDEQKTEARRQLRAEGKIGPDAKPRVWQITEERVGLLEYCLETLLDAPDIEEIPGPGHSIEMLRAMLREAEQ